MAVDLQQYYKDPGLEEARTGAQTAQTQASAYQSASSLLPEKLKQAIGEKLDYNKDIIEAKNKAMAEYFQAPSAAREKYQDIWNPFEREKLVAEERTQAYLPFANLTDILKERRGGITDIIGAATGLFGADVSAKQSAADISRQGYLDKFGLADAMAGAAQAEAQLAKGAGGGGTSGLGDIISLLQATGVIPGDEGAGQAGPTEPKPEISEQQIQRMRNNPAVMWRSPEGQWYFDFETDDWIPIVD
jgi:hypothetical protein